jgi:hypothetical protein
MFCRLQTLYFRELQVKMQWLGNRFVNGTRNMVWFALVDFWCMFLCLKATSYPLNDRLMTVVSNVKSREQEMTRLNKKIMLN